MRQEELRPEVLRMIETGKVAISNDPFVPDFKREATLKSFLWNPVERVILLICETKWISESEDNPVPQRLNPYEVRLETCNTPHEGEELSEYDQFVEASKNPIIIHDLIYNTIMLRDSQGRFDK